MLKRITQAVNFYWKHQQALRHRNYRLFLEGQSLSLIGTWIQRLAMIWLVYRLTGSAFLLGVVGFCEQIPIFLVAPFAGVYADRWNKHKALCRLQTFALIQALMLGLLTLSHLVEVWHVMLLSLCLGTINAFEVPVRQSFVLEMVNKDKAAMTNAIALNSTVFNGGRLIGPAVAGILIGLVGEGWCFMINAGSFAAVLMSLLQMRLPPATPVAGDEKQVIGRLKEGAGYVFKNLTMRSLLILLAVASLMSNCLKILAPVFAKQVLNGNAHTLGFLMSASGAGAIFGALYLTNRRASGRLMQIIAVAALGLGSTMILFALSGKLFFSLLFMGAGGLCQMLHVASTNTLLQLTTADDKRGRVMSFYTMASQGMQPFGSLLSGAAAGIFGGPWTVGSMGAVVLVSAGLYGRFFKRRRDKEDASLP